MISDNRRAYSRLRDVEWYKRRKPLAEPTANTPCSELKHMPVTLDCSASSSTTAVRDSVGSCHSHKAPSLAPANRWPGLHERAVNGRSHVVMVCKGEPLSRLNTRMRLKILQNPVSDEGSAATTTGIGYLSRPAVTKHSSPQVTASDGEGHGEGKKGER